METIVQILISQVRERLVDVEMGMTLTRGAVELLLEKGFDPDLGARPMRRAIQRYIEDPLSDLVLRGKFKAGAMVRVTKRGEVMGFEEGKPGEPPAEETPAGEGSGAEDASDSLVPDTEA